MLDLDDITHNNARDILNATPEAVAMALGHTVRSPHPFAELVAETPLRAAAFAAGQLLAARRPGEPEAAIVGRGLRTLDFGNAVAAALQAAARRKYDFQAQHRSVVANVEVKRLGEPEPAGAVDLSTPFTDVTSGSEYTFSRASTSDGETVQVNSLGGLIEISRQAIFNDELDLLQAAVAETGVAAARLEARLVAAALEANPNLTDGSPVFDAAHGNVVAAAFGTDGEGLAAAMAALRNQPAADGYALEAQPATVFVAPDLEFNAVRQLGAFLSGQWMARGDLYSDAGVQRIKVVVLSGLPSGRYFVAPSPDVARSIAVARLAGQSHPLTVEAVRAPSTFDGAVVRVRIDTGVAMIGRAIVRGGA